MNRLTSDVILLHLRRLSIRAFAILGITIGGTGLLLELSRIQQGYSLALIIPPILIMAACGLWLALIDRDQIRTAVIGLCITLVLATYAPPPQLFVAAIAAVLATAVLGNRVAYIAVNVWVLVRFFLQPVLAEAPMPLDLVSIGSWIVAPLIVVVVTGLTARYFITHVEQISQSTARATLLLQSTAEITQLASQTLEMTTLLNRAIQLISDRFGFYHTQIFLLDPTREYAQLIASTGEVGQQLLQRRHRLSVGSRSVIGQVTAVGKPVIARDSDSDSVRFRNELLPWTRAELAIPIQDDEEIIGALDVQSKDVNAFSETEVQALQVLASLLATSIRNARLFEQQAETSRENERLYREAQANYDEIQRLNRELTGQAWQDFLRETSTTSGVTLVRGKLGDGAAWTEALTQAASGSPLYETHDDKTHLALPLTLRGEVIGAVEIEAKSVVSNEEVEYIRDVLDRLSVSLENARLFEAAQSATAQEARLNQIASRYEQVNSVDDLLRITLQELSQSLGAERGTIRLSSVPVEHENGESAS